MAARLTDTTPEAEKVLTDIYRQMPMGRKWLNLGDMYTDARSLHAAGVRLRNPTATDRDIYEQWLTINLGLDPTGVSMEPAPLQAQQNLKDFRQVAGVLDRLGIAYALGGSMASSIHGMDRFSRDADITIEPFLGKEDQFAAELGPDYYVSIPSIRDAHRHQSCFNIIKSTTGFKLDFFVLKDEPFEQLAMQRRQKAVLPDAPGQPVIVHSPEDIILFKLRWYRLGGEVSENQWNDVQGVFRAQGSKLDDAYLDQWAAEIGVSDLLTRARADASIKTFSAPPEQKS
jgi:hypothetical protein